jgi:hypothetical protein
MKEQETQKPKPPIVEAPQSEFDSALDDLYRQAVRSAEEFGWSLPARDEFEARYKEELAASWREPELSSMKAAPDSR